MIISYRNELAVPINAGMIEPQLGGHYSNDDKGLRRNSFVVETFL